MTKKVIFYFCLTTIILYGLRSLHYKGLLKQTTGYYGKYNTLFKLENNFNVIFLGSSRAEMHYNTGLFDSLTQMNSFNLGTAGATPQLAYSLLKIYLQKSKAPKIMICELDLNSMKFNRSDISDFNNFFPYLADPFIRSELNRIDPRMTHFYYDPYYSFPFTGIENLSTGLHGWLNIPNKSDLLYYKGYHRYISRKQIIPNYSIPKENAYLSIHTRNYLDSIISLCRANKIQPYFISSPVFACGDLHFKNKAQLVHQIKNFFVLRGIPYWDLTCLSFCDQRKLFVDQHHLNAEGSRVFTRYLVDFFSNKTKILSLN